MNGTPGDDELEAVAAGGAAEVKGLPVLPSVTGGEPLLDQLVVNGGAGNDTIEGTPATGTLINAVIDGGPDIDTVFAEGTNGNDTFQIVANGTLAQIGDGGGGFFSVAGLRRPSAWTAGAVTTRSSAATGSRRSSRRW